MRNAHRVLAGISLALLLSGCNTGSPPADWKEYAVAGAYSAAISESGNFATLGSFNHGGSLWDLRKHAREYNWNHKAKEFSLIAATAISPDETYAATANQQYVHLQSSHIVLAACYAVLRAWARPGQNRPAIHSAPLYQRPSRASSCHRRTGAAEPHVRHGPRGALFWSSSHIE